MSATADRWSNLWQVPACIATAIAACAYLRTFQWLVDRWFAPSSYYSHGILIPFVTAYLIWQMREELRAVPLDTSRLGLAIVIAGLLAHALASLLQVFFISGFSLLVVVVGACLYALGGRVTRRIAFPLAFLVFMIPLPMVAIAGLSLKLKLFAAAAAMKVIDLIGLAMVREGSIIEFIHSGEANQLTVGDVCSGLRSLISLLALGALYGHVRGLSRARHLAIFLLSIPIALAANVIRIVGLCVVGYFWGAKAVEGTVHDASGLVLFAVALALLFGVERIIALIGRKDEAKGAAE